jgi:hypothetical protein
VIDQVEAAYREQPELFAAPPVAIGDVA